MKLHRTFFTIRTFVGFLLRQVFRKQADAYAYLFHRLSRLGGIYLKFLQLIALNEDIKDIRFAGLKDVLSIFDQAPYEEMDIIQTLSIELGAKASDLKLDSSKPFAAGSFGQVYAAELNGLPVVIKALRTSVNHNLHFDLGLLELLTRLLGIFQSRSMLDIRKLFHDFREVTLQETDYRHEVEVAGEVYESMASNPVVKIPKTFKDYSTARIIVQERVGGIPLTEILSIDAEDKVGYVWQNLHTDLNLVLEELAVSLLGGSLSPSGTHGDPHPGNIYILPNDRVALIDFGIDARVEAHQSELLQLLTQYVDLYKGVFNPYTFSRAMVGYFVPQLTRSLESLSVYFEATNLVEQIMNEVSLTASKTFQHQAGDKAVADLLSQYRMLNLFTQVINKNNRFGFHTEIEAPTFLRSTQIFLHLVHRLGCDKQLLRRSFERVLNNHQMLLAPQSVDYDNEAIDRSLHSVAEWFERLHYSDPALYNRITHAWSAAV